MPTPVSVNPPQREREMLNRSVSSALSDLDALAGGTTTLTTAQLTVALRKVAAALALVLRYTASREGLL
ncbi:MAG: hypothetical protein ABIK43_03170 [candidate division WOR-3 bacterium]